MSEKKKPPVTPPRDQKLSKDEAENVKGGRMKASPESCKESGDTGMMGCAG